MKNTDSDDLFREFPPISTGEWEEKIRKDLKGADYTRKLIWDTPEGFPVKPYYRAEDLSGLGYLNTIPGEFPFLRGFRNGGNNWTIRQDIPASDPAEANRTAIDAIDRGAGAIGFNAGELDTHLKMKELLGGIDLSVTEIHFFRAPDYHLTTEIFLHETDRRGVDPTLIKGSMNFDPIARLLADGDTGISFEKKLEDAALLVEKLKKRLPCFKAININGYRFQDAGSTLTQELAFALASGSEYLTGLTERGIAVDDLTPRISFTFALGPSYFMEIAKLRAARLLWSTIVNQYGPETMESCRMFIHCLTARWNKTLFDPYINLLRTTTEAMSGILGNANSLAVMPFDAPLGTPVHFAERLARNQQLILREEAFLDKVVDPSAGSYFIENLTDSLAAHAWELFCRTEGMGGMAEAVKKGFIQDTVAASRRQKEGDIARRKLLLLGTNQYPELSERMADKAPVTREDRVEIDSVSKRMKPFRAAEPFEKVRLATERYIASGNRQPTVFLFPMGNLVMQRARAGFAANFFGCAGFRIIDNPGFGTIGQGVKEAIGSEADIVVLCSSDEEYAAFVPEVIRTLKLTVPSILVVIAGNPATLPEELRVAGPDGFINVKSNMLEELQGYQRLLGVN